MTQPMEQRAAFPAFRDRLMLADGLRVEPAEHPGRGPRKPSAGGCAVQGHVRWEATEVRPPLDTRPPFREASLEPVTGAGTWLVEPVSHDTLARCP